MKKSIIALSVFAAFSANATIVETSELGNFEVNEVRTSVTIDTSEFATKAHVRDQITTANANLQLGLNHRFNESAKATSHNDLRISENESRLGMVEDTAKRAMTWGKEGTKLADKNRDSIADVSNEVKENSAHLERVDTSITDNYRRSVKAQKTADKNNDYIMNNIGTNLRQEERLNKNRDDINNNKEMIVASVKYLESERQASVDIINAQNQLQQDQLDNHEARITRTEDKVFSQVEDVRGYVETQTERSDERIDVLAAVAKQEAVKTEENRIRSVKNERVNTARIDHNQAGIQQNTASINVNSKNIAHNSTRISDNSARIDRNAAAIENNKNEIKDLRQDFEKMSKEMSGGIAGVAAMANIPQVRGVGNVSVGVGIGHFNSESAVALGTSYRYNEQVTAQFSVSANTGNDIQPVIGAGVNYEF